MGKIFISKIDCTWDRHCILADSQGGAVLTDADTGYAVFTYPVKLNELLTAIVTKYGYHSMVTFGSLTSEYESDRYPKINILQNIGVANFDVISMKQTKQAKYKVYIVGLV